MIAMEVRVKGEKHKITLMGKMRSHVGSNAKKNDQY